jgi:hypothetical protein
LPPPPPLTHQPALPAPRDSGTPDGQQHPRVSDLNNERGHSRGRSTAQTGQACHNDVSSRTSRCHTPSLRHNAADRRGIRRSVAGRNSCDAPRVDSRRAGLVIASDQFRAGPVSMLVRHPGNA